MSTNPTHPTDVEMEYGIDVFSRIASLLECMAIQLCVDKTLAYSGECASRTYWRQNGFSLIDVQFCQ